MKPVEAEMQAEPRRLTEQAPAAQLLICKLCSFEEISEDDKGLILSTVGRLRHVPNGVRLPTDRRLQSGVVVSGWIGRVRMLADGRRQIVSTILPGDLIGPYANPLVSVSTVSLTEIRIADLTSMVEALACAPDRHVRLRRAMHLASRVEEARLAEQVVRLGRRSAFERVGHWLLDIQARLQASGLDQGDTFAMPLTQETLGDVLGLSLVHVNRIVQQMRLERLADMRGGEVRIYEPERLRMITEYTPLGTAQSVDASGV